MRNPFAKPESVARHLKIAVTGKSGQGKTCFGLDARNHGLGPVAVLSNEAGDVHYIKHSRWGGFDRLPTQRLEEIEQAISYIEANPAAYGTLVIDTVTGIYEGLVGAKAKDDGSVNVKSWGLIKRKWRSLMARLNNLPINIVAVVHENDMVETDDKGSSKIVGQKLDAEKTFERNPDVLLRLYLQGDKLTARVLKDRTGTCQAGALVTDAHIGLWASAIKTGPTEARVSPPEEVDADNASEVDKKPAEPDRTADELKAFELVAACAKGFNAETHRTNWLAKHKPEIAGLKARHPDLYQTVKAAYDAAHSGSNGTQQEVSDGRA